MNFSILRRLITTKKKVFSIRNPVCKGGISHFYSALKRVPIAVQGNWEL